MFKILVLCLAVLAVQALPQVKAPIDDVRRELEDLEREATGEQQKSLDTLGGELHSLGELSQKLVHDLGEDLKRDVGKLEDQIRELEERARHDHVNIQQCIGNSHKEIQDLPEGVLGESSECVTHRYGEAEREINDAVRKVNEATGHIDEYWRRLERCAGQDPRHQEICIDELHNEVRKDAVAIPSLLRLAVSEALGHIESEKGELLGCVAGKSELVLHVGEEIVRRVTDCADHILPPGPGPHPPQ